MKNYLITVLLALLTCPNPLLAQDDAKREYNLQLDIGLLNTLHYNQPVSLNQCIEGCNPEDQDAKLASAFGLNLYRGVDSKNSLKIGFGLSSYRYDEIGQGGTGDGSLAAYEIANKWNFYGISLGYKYTFNPKHQLSFFLEGDVIYELPTDDYTFIQSGLAVQPKIGAQLSINQRWNLIAEGLFKSALTNYSDKNFGDDYKPYAFGIQVGVNFSL